jgi:acetoin utilization deacetylase AcuC-like enzyme
MIRQCAPDKDGEKDYHFIVGDTVLCPYSFEAASMAEGAAIAAVDMVLEDEAENAFCALRPPGHHAERNRAMGFCLFNNAAIAALHARAEHGAERVAVVDFDVHHGNGVQDILWCEPDIFYASTHQSPLYPGTGSANETGAGNILNTPLAPGSNGAKMMEAFDHRILPALHDFSPDLIIMSAGFDAHEDDPLSDLLLREEDFAEISLKIADFADNHCEGRMVSMLEGGYNLKALAASALAHVEILHEAGK